MWSNLAKGLGATDINATLEKIGNAVAPREDDDDEYYDDDDDDYYDEDEDEYDDDDDDQEYDDSGEGIMKKVAGATPFRLAGMLTRALDDRSSAAETVGNDGRHLLYNNDDHHANTPENSYQSRETNGTPHGALFPQEPYKTDDISLDRNNPRFEEPNSTLEQADRSSRWLDEKPASGFHQTSIDGKVDTVSKSIPAETLPTQTVLPSRDSSQNQLITESSKDTTQIVNATQLEKVPQNQAEQLPWNPEMAVTVATIESSQRKAGRVNSEMVDALETAKPEVVEKASRSTKPKGQRNQTVSASTTSNSRPVPPSNEPKQEESVIPKQQNNSLTVGTGTRGNKAVNRLAKDRSQTEAEASGHIVTKSESHTSQLALEGIKEKKMATPATQSNGDNKVRLISDTSSLQNATEYGDIGNDTRNTIQTPIVKSNEVVKEASDLPSQKSAIHEKRVSRKNQECPEPKTKEEVKLPSSNEDSLNELKTLLERANQEIETVTNQAKRDKEKAESEKEALIAQFQSKEARLLQATSEENQNQTLVLEQQYLAKIQDLEQLREKEKKESQDEQEEYKKLLRESYINIERAESQLQVSVNKYENEIAQVKKQEERALRKVDDRMAQTMAILDERNEEISRLKQSIKSMQSKVNEHQEGEEEAEEELEELHQENDTLRATIEKLQVEKKNLKDQVGALKSGTQEVSGLQMELTMLKEELERERAKKQIAVDSASESRAQTESERDNALSELKDSKQQLAAALGDLEIARSDNSRIVMANNNLQSALEAFQDERRAEMDLIDEQRRESEEAIKSAHATATNALKQMHETEMYEIQKASDAAVKNVMQEMELTQGTIRKLKSENNQMRRSLDEAIHRLQTTQEDVIDRNVMKNILVDWCTLNDKNKRHQVLEVMANLLHFSEDEKEKVHLTSKNLDSVRAKVVGALAAPLPPSKADVEHLEGSNVHEKWVNFLMAETDDM